MGLIGALRAFDGWVNAKVTHWIPPRDMPWLLKFYWVLGFTWAPVALATALFGGDLRVLGPHIGLEAESVHGLDVRILAGAWGALGIAQSVLLLLRSHLGPYVFVVFNVVYALLASRFQADAIPVSLFVSFACIHVWIHRDWFGGTGFRMRETIPPADLPP